MILQVCQIIMLLTFALSEKYELLVIISEMQDCTTYVKQIKSKNLIFFNVFIIVIQQ